MLVGLGRGGGATRTIRGVETELGYDGSRVTTDWVVSTLGEGRSGGLVVEAGFCAVVSNSDVRVGEGGNILDRFSKLF